MLSFAMNTHSYDQWEEIQGEAVVHALLRTQKGGFFSLKNK